MVAIIDYDAGNIKSVEKAMQLLGQEVKITRDRDEIMAADHVILRESEHSETRWRSYISTDWWR